MWDLPGALELTLIDYLPEMIKGVNIHPDFPISIK
jgi:hypothetical protein